MCEARSTLLSTAFNTCVYIFSRNNFYHHDITRIPFYLNLLLLSCDISAIDNYTNYFPKWKHESIFYPAVILTQKIIISLLFQIHQRNEVQLSFLSQLAPDFLCLVLLANISVGHLQKHLFVKRKYFSRICLLLNRSCFLVLHCVCRYHKYLCCKIIVKRKIFVATRYQFGVQHCNFANIYLPLDLPLVAQSGHCLLFYRFFLYKCFPKL